jgi:hypothetical protein
MHACDLLETCRKLAGSMPGTSFLSTSVNWFPHLVVYLDFLGTIIGSQHFFPLWHMLFEGRGSSIQKRWCVMTQTWRCTLGQNGMPVGMSLSLNSLPRSSEKFFFDCFMLHLTNRSNFTSITSYALYLLQ